MVSATVFQHSCEELLRGLVLPHSQFVALVEKHEGWDDKALTAKLKARMGERDFEVYTKFANRVNKRIVLLGEKLRLRRDLTVSPTATSFLGVALTALIARVCCQRSSRPEEMQAILQEPSHTHARRLRGYEA